MIIQKIAFYLNKLQGTANLKHVFTMLEQNEWYRASASGSVDLGLIPSRVKPMTLKLVFTASLLDVQH